MCDITTQTGARCASLLLPAGAALGTRQWRMSRSAHCHGDSAAEAASVNGALGVAQGSFSLPCWAAVTTRKITAVGNLQTIKHGRRHGGGAPYPQHREPAADTMTPTELLLCRHALDKQKAVQQLRNKTERSDEQVTVLSAYLLT